MSSSERLGVTCIIDKIPDIMLRWYCNVMRREEEN